MVVPPNTGTYNAIEQAPGDPRLRQISSRPGSRGQRTRTSSLRCRRAEEGRLRRLVRSLLAWPGAPWTGGSLVLILGALALVLFTGGSPTGATTVPQEYATDITYGPKGARVVLVEYADFQC